MFIPDYLKEIAFNASEKKNNISFNIKCHCGCEKFEIYENYLTKAEKELEKPYYDKLEYCISHRSTYMLDENGVPHHYIIDEDHNIAEEVILPERPDFSGRTIIKIKCGSCEKEYVLFDSKKHGYDGVMCSEECVPYEFHFKKKNFRNSPLRKIENDATLEEFRENSGDENVDGITYSNAFTWIVIYVIDENGRKRKISDIETA